MGKLVGLSPKIYRTIRRLNSGVTPPPPEKLSGNAGTERDPSGGGGGRGDTQFNFDDPKRKFSSISTFPPESLSSNEADERDLSGGDGSGGRGKDDHQFNLDDPKRKFSSLSTFPPEDFSGNAAAETDPSGGGGGGNDPQFNFDDTKRLFSSLSTLKLFRSSLTLELAAMERLVDLGIKVMNSPLMENPIFRWLALGITKRTFYAHFCAGTNLDHAANTVQKLRQSSGITAMLDYAMEHADDNESCDQNLNQFLKTITWTSSVPNNPVSYVVVKITAICPSNLLRRISDLLRWQQKDSSFHLPWKMRTLPIFSENSPLYHTLQRPDALTLEEERDLELAQKRFEKICEQAQESGIPLLIDAEDTKVQPAIDYFAYSAAIRHSNGLDARTPLLYNTIQAYLADAKDRLVKTKKAADAMSLPVGFKLVRGAYMSSETAFADSLKVKSPIHMDLKATHTCYNQCADFLLDGIARGSGSLVLATHNIESCKSAAQRAVNLGIGKESHSLHYAQLYGMADTLSFGLRNAGFRVSKYLPFGPVDQVMPYLLRRAEENRGMLSTTTIDRLLMRKELGRRLSIPLKFTSRSSKS